MMEFVSYLLLLTGGFAGLWLAFHFIEGRYPRWDPRGQSERGWRTDLAHYFFTNILVWLLSIFVIYRIVEFIDVPAFLEPFRSTVASWPFWLNLLVLVLVQDLVQYWIHRAFHHFSVLWRFHAIHHSSTRLDWLANARDHPIDQLARRAGITFILAFLGLSEQAFVFFATVIGPVHAYLVHANVRLKVWWLDYLVVTPNYHHWHHAIHPKDKNFAGRFPVLDLLFGTFYRPPSNADPITGCEDAVPDGYWNQLSTPFRGSKILIGIWQEPQSVKVPVDEQIE